MKTAFIFFKNAEQPFVDYIKDSLSVFSESAGFSADTVSILSSSDDIGFKRNLEHFKDTVDNLVIVGGELADFDFKRIVAENHDTVLAENENAKRFAEAVAKSENLEYSDEYSLIPLEATLVPNLSGLCQGFMLDDKDFTLISLPHEYESLKDMCLKYVVPYLESKFAIKRKKLTLKYLGDEFKLTSVLKKAQSDCEGLKYSVSEKYGDYTVNLIFENCPSALQAETVRLIVGALKEDIYAETDVTLSVRLFDLLKLRRLKIAVAESFTGGRVVNEIIKNSGASEFVVEGIVCYSNESKQSRLKVKRENIVRDGAVSSIVAYQMAAGLLTSETGCDVAIATTGIAGPKSDDSDKPVGLCYIAVGTKEGVHTYKFNFTGDRETVTEKAKNHALFLAIKNLKK